ncbi:hypothetical protein SDJN03_10028, partial [Cucurbita argyrosperma subsp. sororia]
MMELLSKHLRRSIIHSRTRLGGCLLTLTSPCRKREHLVKEDRDPRSPRSISTGTGTNKETNGSRVGARVASVSWAGPPLGHGGPMSARPMRTLEASAHGLGWTGSHIGLVVDLGWLRVGARRRPKICMGHGNFDSNSAIWATHPSRLRFGF